MITTIPGPLGAPERTLWITQQYLVSKGACNEQIDAFAEVFPEGIEVTEELAVQHAGRFDWIWAIANLLDYPQDDLAYAEEVEAFTVRQKAMLNLREREYPLRTEEEREAHRAERLAVYTAYDEAAARIFAKHFIAQRGRACLDGEAVMDSAEKA
jgi:hypothetical protein